MLSKFAYTADQIMTWGNKRTPAQAARAFRSAETRRNKVRAFCSEHSMTRAEFAEK